MPEFASPLLRRPPNAKEKRAGAVILRHWRRFVTAKTHRDLAKMYGTLGSMAKPVGTLDEFMEHLLKGRVLVQANVYRPKSDVPVTAENFDHVVRADEPYDYADRPVGHFGFFYRKTKHELSLGQDRHVRSKEFKAKYPVEELNKGSRVLVRAYVRKDENFMQDQKKFLGELNDLMAARLLFVLDAKYSDNFERAIEDESNFFKDQPYSYGLHYNCLSFAQGALDRLQASTPNPPPSAWARFRSKFW